MGQCALLRLESFRRVWNSSAQLMKVLISKVSWQRSQSGSNCSFEEPVFVVFVQTWEPWPCFQPHLWAPISGLRSRWSTIGWCRIPMPLCCPTHWSRRRPWWPQWRPWAPHQFKSNSRRSHHVQFTQCRCSSRWWRGCKGMRSYRGQWRWTQVSRHQKPVGYFLTCCSFMFPNMICVDSSYRNVTCLFFYFCLKDIKLLLGLQAFSRLIVVWCPFLRWYADDMDTAGPHATEPG